MKILSRLMAAYRAWQMRRAMRELDEMRAYMERVSGRDVEGGKLPPGMWD